jgi:hypothetical protein
MEVNFLNFNWLHSHFFYEVRVRRQLVNGHECHRARTRNEIKNFFQLTASIVKPLGFKKPTGHNLIIEWDLFYPLITTWKQPEVTLKPRTTTRTTTELPVETVESWTAPKEIWQPEGGWTSDVIEQINTQNKNSAAAVGSRRRVDNNNNVSKIRIFLNFFNLFP